MAELERIVHFADGEWWVDMTEEQPDPKHQHPEGMKPQEVYKGVPIMAYQDDDMASDEYGLTLFWYGRPIDAGSARLGKPYLDLVQEAKQTIDLLLEVESQGALNENGTLKQEGQP